VAKDKVERELLCHGPDTTSTGRKLRLREDVKIYAFADNERPKCHGLRKYQRFRDQTRGHIMEHLTSLLKPDDVGSKELLYEGRRN
jgi:hypothetical protein